jgi:glycosyltransferase involved in cell wall biosynthesis
VNDAANAQRPIRVLMLTNMYPSATEPGYGSFVARQRRELEEKHGVVVRLVYSSRRGGGAISNLRKYAELLMATLGETLRGDYDVVHAHYLLPMAALALIPSAWRRRPLVITAHGTDIYSGTRRAWKPWIVRALMRACRIVVVSRFLADRLVENFGVTPPQQRPFLIANMGVNTDVFTPGDRDALKRAAGLPLDAPHLLFVGNFVEQKGVTDLARALVLLKERGVEFRATLLGHGPEMPEVREVVEPLGMLVAFREVVSHGDLVDIFRSADLFVLPSRREGVGLLVCLESLSCGVPVACGRAGGLPEIVHDGENGVLFEPGNPIAIADSLQALLGDPGRLSMLASRARESALPFSEAEQAEKVYRVYEECVKGRA